MKKTVFFCMVLAIFLCYTIAYAQTDEISTLKVGLYYDSTALDSAMLEADGGFDYGTYSEEFEVSGSMAETSLSIVATDSTLVINDGVTFDYEVALYPTSGYFKINNSYYRGGVLLKAAESKITVINLVDIEEYLYGVIGSEMPSSWNIEALKAQAVCARNFTITNINKHASLGFNVCATTNCQVYKGISAENPNITRAVDETRGNVLMYEDSPAETLYYSSSGGHTANAKNVWGSDIPYLRGVEDPYESESAPRHSWTATMTAGEIKDALENSDIYIGDITGMKTENDHTGRVQTLTITGTEGTHTIKGTSSVSLFSSHGVLSSKYTLSASSSDNALEVFLKSAYKTSKASEYYVISGKGTKTKISQSFYALTSKITSFIQPSASSPDEYIFNGGGWGHGVGMSQYGAQGMAENGFTFDEILSHYYPGTYLETR